jgi:hypothetical protein
LQFDFEKPDSIIEHIHPTFTDEEIKQRKRDYYKNNYYVNHREVCLERAKKAHLRQKAAKAE